MLTASACWQEPAPQPYIEPAPPTPAEEYLQLQAGNYWVYQTYQYDWNSKERTPLSKRDSLYAGKELTQGRSVFQRLQGTRLGQPVDLMLRMRNTEALDTSGRVYFATDRPGEPFPLSAAVLPEEAAAVEMTVDTGSLQTVPYGTFETLSATQSITLLPKYGGEGGGPHRIDTAYYSIGVGLIRYVRYYPEQQLSVGMELVRKNF